MTDSKHTTPADSTLKPFEKPTIEIVLFDTADVVVTSGCNGDTCPSNECTSTTCLSAGTKITMADGTVKNIEDITQGDLVLSYDHEAGRLVGSPILYAYKGDEPKCAFTLRFANGTELSIVGEHDLFEQESRKYVYISEDNAEQFIGKHFYSVSDKAFVELLTVTRETEAKDYYEIYTAKTLNSVANGMLNVADDVDYLINIYEFDEFLNADKEKLAADIEEYGLKEYSDDFKFSEQEYEAWNSRYLLIAVGKGLVTMDDIISSHNKYMDK